VVWVIGLVLQPSVVMAKSTSSAKRTNRVLASAVIVVLLGAAIAASVQFSGEASAPSTSDAPVVTPPANSTGSRPAEIGYSWFDHGFASEQIDFDMPALSCASVADTITPDLCAVARATSGAFMLVGTEGFWDPEELDADGTSWVPLDLTVFVMRTDIEGPRAISVLDGSTEKAYTDVGVSIDLYTANIDGDDVLVLHKRLTNSSDDPFSFRESVQILAMSPTGAPTLVATYEGHQMRVAASGSTIEMSSLRYRTSNTSPNPQWFTRVSVKPSARDIALYSWDEIVTSNDAEIPSGQDMKLQATYDFPVASQTAPNF
jgi:hypothetical protein